MTNSPGLVTTVPLPCAVCLHANGCVSLKGRRLIAEEDDREIPRTNGQTDWGEEHGVAGGRVPALQPLGLLKNVINTAAHEQRQVDKYLFSCIAFWAAPWFSDQFNLSKRWWGFKDRKNCLFDTVNLNPPITTIF